jgi:hypothetical protein
MTLNQEMENVQINITPSEFSICKERLKPAAVTSTKSQRLLIMDADVIADFIFTSSRVIVNGSL